MLQHDTDSFLKVKILDFGLAKRFQDPLGLNFEGFRKDIGEVVRIFSALYTGEEFDNVRDARNNWRTKLNEVSLLFNLITVMFLLLQTCLGKQCRPNQTAPVGAV